VGLSGGYSLLYLIGSGLASLYYVVRTVRGIYREEHYGRAFVASILYMLVVMVLINLDILVQKL
jgi:heme O synthase-like polyprenyltransferase